MSVAKVVYVVGSGRSGSTLLERTLGAVPGFVNVGEVIDVFRRVVDNDELCGCGARFLYCDFWRGVGERAYGGWSPEFVAETCRLQQSVARHRHLGTLLAPASWSPRFHERLERYGEIYARFYAAVLEESGARVVVDASKGAAQAVAISKSRDVDLRVIHLVRDVRGVAFSWAKADVARPQGNAPGSVMKQHHPARTAVHWNGLQAASEVARRAVPTSVVLRYEDFVAEPSRQLHRTLEALGLSESADQLAHVDGNTVHLPPSHGVSGNPSRFRAGGQELRRDDQWRRDMPRRDRVAVTSIAIAPLARYGYLGRPSRGGA